MCSEANKTLTLRNSTENIADSLGPVAQLFCVLQGSQPIAPSARHRISDVDEIMIGRTDGADYMSYRKSAERSHTLHIRVPDPWMSSRHARLYFGEQGLEFKDLGSRNGSRINGVKCDRATLADHAVIELGQTFFIYRSSLEMRSNDESKFTSVPTRREAHPREGVPTGVRTLIPSLGHQFERLQRFAKSDVSIVILGESGTGKDVLASAIHALSGVARKDVFVPLNCGAIPEGLLESELFGHVKGAFNGAENRQGLIQAADNGTLFLDEIGDMPLSAQVAFLRVLQDGKVRQVGSSRAPSKVQFRVIAATHQPLEAMLDDGRFREDLWARLSEHKVRLPALRERREDLGIFIAELLETLAGKDASRLKISADAGRALLAYRWPLNVRELRKCLKTALVLADQVDEDGRREIRLEHLPREIRIPAPENRFQHESHAPASALNEQDTQRKSEIIARLRREAGNVSKVAEQMGKARNQVMRWINRYGIDVNRYRKRSRGKRKPSLG